ncbi:MAG: TonB-dependent receptor [Bacteroidales bacterium]|nr:TonB-dependent receptor [Bacteroidales bacterium]
MKKRFYLLIAMLLMFVGVASAQVTTSGLTGQVTSENGETLPGATVIAVHVPSGTQYACITNESGRYVLQGMRPGGPYSITYSFVGLKNEVYNDVNLSLGEVAKYNAQLKSSDVELNEIVVVGVNPFDAAKTGASQRISSDDIQNLPSVSHSIADATRMNPQISISQSGAMSFAGASNRYNSFQVDGAMNNDVFGLTSNGSNGGQAGAQPISMETIEQIQVSVAPFDVRQSGFTGGAINAVTKSGTNEFHGSIYGNWLNQGLIGSKYEMMNGKDSEKYDDELEYRFGFTVGGPIVKNKIFFFANYENSNKEYPCNYSIGSAASKVDANVANDILDVLKNKGYTGSFDSKDNYTKSDKLGLKLDFNISTKHKASISWRLVDAKQLNSNSTATNLNASDYMYDFKSRTNTITAELQSRFTEKLSNEFQASFVQVRDSRNPSGAFPMISISNVGGGSVNLGCERSSCANGLDQDIYTITDNFTWYNGNHTLTFGTHDEFYKFGNLFIQDFYGTYYFANVDNFYDFVNGNAVNAKGANTLKQYRYGSANVDVTGTARWIPEFGAGQIGFYAQDKWAINNNFDLTYGLRVDIPLFFDSPSENAPFNEYAAQQGWDIKTNHKLSSNPMWSPRLGFRWDMSGDSKNVLRGGVGIFTGRIPFVWLSNNFSNTGIQLSTYNTSNAKDLEQLSFIADPNGQTANTSKLAAAGSQTINVFTNDFKFAQTLRFNLGVDFNLGGVDWTAEGIYSKSLNDVVYYNYAYDLDNEKTLGSVSGLNFDNRPYMKRVTDGTPYSGIYVLDNTNEGYSYSLSFSGKKNFKSGLGLYASYTFTHSQSVNSGTSSVAQSNYNYNYTYKNPNSPELGNTAYNFPHKITASVTYNKEYAKHWKSTISLIYTGMSGAPYSIYVYGDMNGDGVSGNDLQYIPTDAQIDQMPFISTWNEEKQTGYTEDMQRAAMKAWIANDDYMSEHRGEYFERYADNEDFEHHFDFHFAQQFKFNVGKRVHAIEFSFDVLNVGNMFSPKWGRYAQAAGSSTYYSPVTFNNKTNAYQFLHDENYNMRSYSDYYSRWRGQIGLKYIF